MNSQISDQIREHQAVLASRGAGSVQVGTVDHLEGNYVKLTRKDSPSGQHRWIPLHWVGRVEGGALYLSKSEDEFRQGAMTQNPEAQPAAIRQAEA